MNKEQLRKELEDAIMIGRTDPRRSERNAYINSRLAALDDVDQKKGQCNDPAIYYKDDVVDDGQEGKGLGKEWEIVSFIDKRGNIHRSHHYHPDTFATMHNEKTLTVHSVRRLSDNEVFAVGDEVCTDSSNGNYKITSFLIKPDDMMADLGGNGCVFLKYLRKKITPAPPVADGEGEKVGEFQQIFSYECSCGWKGEWDKLISKHGGPSCPNCGVVLSEGQK